MFTMNLSHFVGGISVGGWNDKDKGSGFEGQRGILISDLYLMLTLSVILTRIHLLISKV